FRQAQSCLFEYYAIAPSPLSSDVITMTASGTQCQVVTMLIAFGISGTLQQFDPNPNGRGVFTCSGGGCTNPVTVPITTSHSNDILIGAGSLSAAQDPQVISPTSCCTSIHQEG